MTARTPAAPPADALAALARTLERWARSEADVQAALAGLPRFDRHAAGASTA